MAFSTPTSFFYSSSASASSAIASRNSSFVCLSNNLKEITINHRGFSSSVSVSSPPAVTIPIESSSRPQKKCTAHHNKTRPKKHNPSDKNRKPPVYPKPPKAPPAFTWGWGDEAEEGTPSISSAPTVVIIHFPPLISFSFLSKKRKP